MKKLDEEIKKIKEFRLQFYNSHARDYNTYQNDDFLSEFEGFKKIVKISPGQIVLDIATGTGTYLIQMAKMGAVCYGIDQSPNMLEELKSNFLKLGRINSLKDIKIGAAEILPYPDAFFNWITCIGMFEYYPLKYVEIVLSEVKRILRPDGYFFFDFADPNKKYVQERDWIFIYDLDELKRLLKSLHFKTLRKNKAGQMIQLLLSKKQQKVLSKTST
ncbi:MAG: class I SAM-dependent methyltransferase [Candidatus Thorarchaeota archaeon]